jgi:hypothetical protein
MTLPNSSKVLTLKARQRLQPAAFTGGTACLEYAGLSEYLTLVLKGVCGMVRGRKGMVGCLCDASQVILTFLGRGFWGFVCVCLILECLSGCLQGGSV